MNEYIYYHDIGSFLTHRRHNKMTTSNVLVKTLVIRMPYVHNSLNFTPLIIPYQARLLHWGRGNFIIPNSVLTKLPKVMVLNHNKTQTARILPAINPG